MLNSLFILFFSFLLLQLTTGVLFRSLCSYSSFCFFSYLDHDTRMKSSLIPGFSLKGGACLYCCCTYVVIFLLGSSHARAEREVERGEQKMANPLDWGWV